MDMDYRKFLQLALASRLLNHTDLDRIREGIPETKNGSSSDTAQLALLTEYLVAEGLLTRWQCAMLASGRYKGFFLGRYKLMEWLPASGASVYRAVTTDTREPVEITVMPGHDVVEFTVRQDGRLIDRASMAREHDQEE